MIFRWGEGRSGAGNGLSVVYLTPISDRGVLQMEHRRDLSTRHFHSSGMGRGTLLRGLFRVCRLVAFPFAQSRPGIAHVHKYPEDQEKRSADQPAANDRYPRCYLEHSLTLSIESKF